MVFKRKTPRNMRQWLVELVYPAGGWRRAASYVIHRVRRIPDPPHRVARGVAAGIFVSFTPLFGFHLILAVVLALILRGNILAALLGTLFGNPFTLPLIATVSVEMGAWMRGLPDGMPLYRIVADLSAAMFQLWHNILAMFTSEPTNWDRLGTLFDGVFLSYLVGGLVPGIVSGGIGYAVTHRIIEVYQKSRVKRLKARVAKRRAAADRAAEETLGLHGIADRNGRPEGK